MKKLITIIASALTLGVFAGSAADPVITADTSAVPSGTTCSVMAGDEEAFSFATTGGEVTFELDDKYVGRRVCLAVGGEEITDSTEAQMGAANPKLGALKLAGEGETPRTITATTLACTEFTIDGESTELNEGDIVYIPSTITGDAWHGQEGADKLAGHEVVVGKRMNWKWSISKMTIESGNEIFFYGSLTDATISGEGKFYAEEAHTINGATTITSQVGQEKGGHFVLADGATLTVADKLADGMVTSADDDKYVIFDESAKTYSARSAWSVYATSLTEFVDAKGQVVDANKLIPADVIVVDSHCTIGPWTTNLNLAKFSGHQVVINKHTNVGTGTVGVPEGMHLTIQHKNASKTEGVYLRGPIMSNVTIDGEGCFFFGHTSQTSAIINGGTVISCASGFQNGTCTATINGAVTISGEIVGVAGTLKLADGATLTMAQNDKMTVTTEVSGKTVKYEEGVYSLIDAKTYPEYVEEEEKAAYDTWSETYAEAIATASDADIKAGFILNCAPTASALKTVADGLITADIVAALSNTDDSVLNALLKEIEAKYGDKVTIEMTPFTGIDGIDVEKTHLFKLTITIK